MRKFVTTRVEYQWDENLQRYVEIPETREGYWYEGPWALAHNGHQTDQVHFCFYRTDTSTRTEWAAIDTAPVGIQLHDKFMLRLQLAEVGGDTNENGPHSFGLQYRRTPKDGTAGSWTNVTAISPNPTTPAVVLDIGPYAESTDGETTDNARRLTTTGTLGFGRVKALGTDVGSATATLTWNTTTGNGGLDTWSIGYLVELEYCLTFNRAAIEQWSPGDLIEFRATHESLVLTFYTLVPGITLANTYEKDVRPSSNHVWRNDDGSETTATNRNGVSTNDIITEAVSSDTDLRLRVGVNYGGASREHVAHHGLTYAPDPFPDGDSRTCATPICGSNDIIRVVSQFRDADTSENGDLLFTLPILSSSNVQVYRLAVAHDPSTRTLVGTAAISTQITTPETISVSTGATSHNVYILDSDDNTIHQYTIDLDGDTTSWAYSNNSYALTNTVTTGIPNTPAGIAVTSGSLFVYDNHGLPASRKLYRYSMTVHDISTSSHVSGEEKQVTYGAGSYASGDTIRLHRHGITVQCAGNPGSIARLWWDNPTSATRLQNSVQVGTAWSPPSGPGIMGQRRKWVTEDGSVMYFVANNGETYRVKFGSSNWTDTAVPTANFLTSSYTTDISGWLPADGVGWCFSDDGRMLFVRSDTSAVTTTDIIRQYELPIPWELKGARYISQVDITAGTGYGWGIACYGRVNNSTDEYRFIIPDAENRILREFVVGSSGLVTNGSFTANTFDLSAAIALDDLIGVQVVATGTASGDVHVYVVNAGPNPSQIRHYTLTTWNNISTMSLQETGSLAANGSGYVCVSPDGRSIVEVDYSLDQVRFNTMSTAFDVSTLGTASTAKASGGDIPWMTPDGATLHVLNYINGVFSRYALAHDVRLLSSTGGSRFAQYYTSSNITNGGDTTQQITSGSYITNNNGIIESGRMGFNEYGAGDAGVTSAEYEWTVRLKSADWSNLTHCLLFGVDSAPLDDSEARVTQGPNWSNWPFVVKATAGGTQTINANSVADAAAVSDPLIQNLLSIIDTPTSIPDGSSVSSPQVAPGQVQISADSVADAAAVGSPTINTISTINADSVTDAASVSNPQVSPGAVTIQADSVADSASVPSPQVILAGAGEVANRPITFVYRVKPTSIADAALVGTPTVQAVAYINADSVADAASVGTPTVENLLKIVEADSVTDTASVSDPQVVPGTAQIQADSVTDTATVGDPLVQNLLQQVQADSVTDTATVSNPQLVPGVATIQADSVSDTANVESPSVLWDQFINANSVTDTAAVGTPSVNQGTYVIFQPITFIWDAFPGTIADTSSVGVPLVNVAPDIVLTAFGV